MMQNNQLTASLTLVVRPHGAKKRKRTHPRAKHVLRQSVFDAHLIAKVRTALSSDPTIANTIATLNSQQLVNRACQMIDAGELHVVDNLAYASIPIMPADLADLFGAATSDSLQQVATELNSNLSAFGLGTLLQRAHFFAQVRAEAGPAMQANVESLNYNAAGLKKNFSYFRKHEDEATSDARTAKSPANQAEIANRVYALRNGNDDYDSGDGWAFRGRGLVQVTGKGNYGAVTKAYNQVYKPEVDFIKSPDLMSQFPYSLRAAVCFWLMNKLPAVADLGSHPSNVDKVTRVVNKNTPTYPERRSYFKTAYAALMSLSALIIGWGTLASSSAWALPTKSLQCASNEKPLFTCSVGEKTAVLCGSLPSGSRSAVTYRYGTASSIENEFAATTENKNRFSAFTAPLRPGARIDQVWFNQGNYRYLMSECVGGMCPQSSRLTVFLKNRVISNRACAPSASVASVLNMTLLDAEHEKSLSDLVTYDPADNDIEALYR